MLPHITASRRRSRGISFSHAMAFLGGMLVGTLFLLIFQGSTLHTVQELEHFAEQHLKANNVECDSQVAPAQKPNEHIAMVDVEYHSTHGVAGLDCSTHGGPSSQSATKELVYWKDLPLDSEFISPLFNKDERQYLTFEPDGGKGNIPMDPNADLNSNNVRFDLQHRWLEQHSHVNGEIFPAMML